MKLTKNTINAIVNLMSRNRKIITLDSDVVQALLNKELNITNEEFDQIRALRRKGLHIGTPYNIYTCYPELVEFKFTKPVITFNSTSTAKILRSFVPEETKIDWTIVLSSFSTVEEVIKTYPQLTPWFEELFKIKFTS